MECGTNILHNYSNFRLNFSLSIVVVNLCSLFHLQTINVQYYLVSIIVNNGTLYSFKIITN